MKALYNKMVNNRFSGLDLIRALVVNCVLIYSYRIKALFLFAFICGL